MHKYLWTNMETFTYRILKVIFKRISKILFVKIFKLTRKRILDSQSSLGTQKFSATLHIKSQYNNGVCKTKGKNIHFSSFWINDIPIHTEMSVLSKYPLHLWGLAGFVPLCNGDSIVLGFWLYMLTWPNSASRVSMTIAVDILRDTCFFFSAAAFLCFWYISSFCRAISSCSFCCI